MSKSNDTILLQYEVQYRIFIAIFKKKKNKNWEKNKNVVHFKVNLFYLMHFESSKLRAPTHVLKKI